MSDDIDERLVLRCITNIYKHVSHINFFVSRIKDEIEALEAILMDDVTVECNEK